MQRILRSLEAKRVIAVTLEGGNKTFKGAATVYRIMAMPKRPKGDTDVTLKGDTHDTLHESVGGDKSGTKGDISDTKGDISGLGRVTPMSPHQVNRSGPLDQSDSFESASPASQPRADDGTTCENAYDYYDIESILENLEDELGFGPGEENMAEAMLQRGIHPNAVRNTINRQRLGEIFNDVKQDQKRLDEEPRCKTCNVTMSRHAQWLADSGDIHIFATKVT